MMTLQVIEWMGTTLYIAFENKNILFIADKFVCVFLPRGKIWIIVLFSDKMRQPVKNWFCLRLNLSLQR